MLQTFRIVLLWIKSGIYIEWYNFQSLFIFVISKWFQLFPIFTTFSYIPNNMLHLVFDSIPCSLLLLLKVDACNDASVNCHEHGRCVILNDGSPQCICDHARFSHSDQAPSAGDCANELCNNGLVCHNGGSCMWVIIVKTKKKQLKYLKTIDGFTQVWLQAYMYMYQFRCGWSFYIYMYCRPVGYM